MKTTSTTIQQGSKGIKRRGRPKSSAKSLAKNRHHSKTHLLRKLRKEAQQLGLTTEEYVRLISNVSSTLRTGLVDDKKIDGKQLLKWVDNPVFLAMIQWVSQYAVAAMNGESVSGQSSEESTSTQAEPQPSPGNSMQQQQQSQVPPPVQRQPLRQLPPVQQPPQQIPHQQLPVQPPVQQPQHGFNPHGFGQPHSPQQQPQPPQQNVVRPQFPPNGGSVSPPGYPGL